MFKSLSSILLRTACLMAFALVQFAAFAQQTDINAETERLLTQLKHATGEQRYEIYNDLISINFSTENECRFSKQLYHEAHNNGNISWEAKAISLICRYYHNFDDNDSVVTWAKKIEQLPLEPQIYLAYFDTEFFLSVALLYNGKIEESMRTATTLQQQAIALNSKDGEITCYELLADIMYETKMYDKSIESYKSCYDLLLSLPTRRATYEYQILSQILLIQIFMGDYVEMPTYLNKVKRLVSDQLIKESWGRLYERTIAVNTIFEANYLIGTNRLAEAEEKLKEFKTLSDNDEIFIQQLELNAYATLAEKKGDYNAALQYYLRFEEIDDYNEWNTAIRIATTYNRLKNFSQSSAYYQKAINTYRKTIALHYASEFQQFSRVCQQQYIDRMTHDYEIAAIKQTVITLIVMLIVFGFIGAGIVTYNIRRRRLLEELVKAETKLRIDRDKMATHNHILRNTYDHTLMNSSMKMLFLSNMSHEIRTPLNSIVGFSTLLSEIAQDDEQKEYVKIICDNSNALMIIINNFLELSRIDANKLSLLYEAVDISRIAQEIGEAERTQRQAEHIQFSVECDSPNTTVITDRKRISQVLRNLLSNAFKFTPEGYVKVIIHNDHKRCSFAVEDTGCGVPIEKVPVIFDRFEKFNAFVPGSGLGLSICKGIINKMGGEIFVDTEYIRGFRMVVNLPQKHQPN